MITGVGVGVGVGGGVGVAIRLETAPHPDNPGKSNKESSKMPPLKSTFFLILDSFRGSVCRPTVAFSRAAKRSGAASAGTRC